MTVHIEIMLACNLKEDTPQQIIETLKFMAGTIDYEPENLAFAPVRIWEGKDDFYGLEEHPWRNIFKFDNYGPDLARFPGTGIVQFHPCSRDTSYYKLTVRVEGYTHNDFEQIWFPFLKWLAPYVDTEFVGNFAGYFQRANNVDTINPVLIYFSNGKVYFSDSRIFGDVKESKEIVEATENNIGDFVFPSK
jgi:hypothetical protein